MTARTRKVTLLAIGSLVLAGALGYGGYSYYLLYKENQSLKGNLGEAQYNLQELNSQNELLNGQLSSAQNIITSFQGQIATITDAVGNLEKLKTIDPELLKKYSKVYFLNENYIPNGLAIIDSQFSYPSTKEMYFLARSWPFLDRMLVDASSTGLSLKVVSAYRSFDTQESLKYSYRVTYGSGANQFSADQGYSEHQLGTAADLTTGKLGANFTAFAKTPEYSWLMENAYKYGFILSYPPKNSYYQYEPWHWRFVGIELATKLHNENKNFYDLDQRDIDGYLLHLFDQ